MSYYENFDEKHTFTFRFDANDGERRTEMICNELYINDVFARFKEFLQGCGYEIRGEIEIVDYDSEKNESQSQKYNQSGYRMTEPPKHEPKFDFSNIPNNNWMFTSQASQQIAPLTTQQIQPWSADLPSNTGEKVKVHFNAY